jgi:hypothetical protein
MKVFYGWRKFALALLIFGAATVLLLLRYITSDQWVNISGAVMLFYGTTNAASKFASKSSGEATTP